ncbi:hypothetical protein SteCoe_34610 [Stentor coeruleus]|uniref:Uncharacterized protein n=1 Tax=Stentor coeruleus TaxID=5963 RepID=A0A1R2AU46_9CILI|nr:hypothetical protein SteCoe_34610 [Stentor coeruleus]
MTSSEFKKAIQWNQTNSKILTLYRNCFNSTKPGTLKNLQQFTSARTENKLPQLSKLKSDLSSKLKVLGDLSRNHITLSTGRKIKNLPMSPFGKHPNYNDETGFADSHFSNTVTSNAVEFEKKTKFLKKKLRRQGNKESRKKLYLKAYQNMEIYKTGAGELYCSNVSEDKSLGEERSKGVSVDPVLEKWAKGDFRTLDTNQSFAKLFRKNYSPLR